MEYQRSFKSVINTDLKLLLLFQKVHITLTKVRKNPFVSV
nr:MAG TPA: hypothetical protein [Caudoviricetes sp.]